MFGSVRRMSKINVIALTAHRRTFGDVHCPRNPTLHPMIRALVIDDDVIFRKFLRSLLTAHGSITVVGEADSVRSGRELFRLTACDLVFLDIQLSDGTGFDLLSAVPPGAKVIFVSAHAESAVRAFDVNALDYLLKPVRPARLAASLQKHETSTGSGTPWRDDVVLLRDGPQARFTSIAKICAIEAEENYSRVHTADGAVSLVRRPLKSWADSLPESHFLQVHRTVIVNLSRITAYRRDASGGIELDVPPYPQPIPVGRKYWMTLKSRLASTAPLTRARSGAESPG